MPTLSAQEIYNLAVKAGFSGTQAATATAIALAESGGNTTALGDTTLQTEKWGPSVGLWQIRSLKAESGTGGVRDATRLTDPAFNARSAYSIYQSQGWNAWTVYKTGAYARYANEVGGLTESSTDETIAGAAAISPALGAVAAVATSDANPLNAILLAINNFLSILSSLPDRISKIGNDAVTVFTAIILIALGIIIITRKQSLPVVKKTALAVGTKGKSVAGELAAKAVTK